MNELSKNLFLILKLRTVETPMLRSSSQGDGRRKCEEHVYASYYKRVRSIFEAIVGQDTIEKLLAQSVVADMYLEGHLGQTNKQSLEQSRTTSFQCTILFYFLYS